MSINFSRNGKWVTVTNGDNKITARMWVRGGTKNQPLSIEKKVAEKILLSLGESIFSLTKEEIEAKLWAAQKAHNRADYKAQEANQLTWWQTQGYQDFKQISTGGNTLTDIAHNGKQIFIGNARIPYTQRAWAKLKGLRSLAEIHGFSWGDVSWSFVSKQAEPEIQAKVAKQEEILVKWANSTPMPIRKK